MERKEALMRFNFVVTIEVSRQEGKFATKDELAEQIQEVLEGADPATLEGENGGQYNIDSWEVNRVER
jgi:hypothetical protein